MIHHAPTMSFQHFRFRRPVLEEKSELTCILQAIFYTCEKAEHHEKNHRYHVDDP